MRCNLSSGMEKNSLRLTLNVCRAIAPQFRSMVFCLYLNSIVEFCANVMMSTVYGLLHGTDIPGRERYPAVFLEEVFLGGICLYF
jgi:hypothetical protein